MGSRWIGSKKSLPCKDFGIRPNYWTNPNADHIIMSILFSFGFIAYRITLRGHVGVQKHYRAT